MRIAAPFRLNSWRAGLLLLAAVAYVPALASSPGRMPADTKLYLYLDPLRLISDAPWSFDARQFAGWVPHQTIAYLWPSGPWYAAAQAVGLPDWVAHRLWIATIIFAAGAGVAWATRRLGLSVPAALAAAAVYELSPYLLPYISRTSSMLLPWAALGWIVGLTVGAATRNRWRDAALCAVVITSTGNVNATALAMIAPAPVLWLLVATVEKRVAPVRALATAARIGALTVATSLWWIVMLVVQGRHGANLLDFSESLEDVSLTATSPEVWRSLGYWLFYIRDPYAPTTTAGADYMTLGLPLVAGYALVLLGLAGLATVAFAARRFAVVLVVVGVLLAVGVHPFGDPSPLAALLTGDGSSTLALALRSSTRAVPLLVLGLALGAAALVDAAAALPRRVAAATAARYAGAAAVAALAVVNLPALTGQRLVDPALERDQHPPEHWSDAAAALDELPDGYRVLQLPGAEFGAFRWGYTVDPPLPGLTERPLITRDLLPLGSPATMDLLHALDDRFQSGVAEPAALAPLARLFGADVIWVTGDVAFDRFRTPRPELVSAFFADAAEADAGLGEPVAYGAAVVNVPDVPMVDELALSHPLVGTPVAPVELVPVDDPTPIIRASARTVVVSGSGDGLVDAAAAGVIAGDEAIRYSAALDDDELAAALAGAAVIVVTDSNRDRAHHWRSAQDVTGYTESGAAGDGPAVLWDDAGDSRLDVFPDAAPAALTTAASVGPLTARATWYGEPFAYRPEARPAMAIDGDPTTAWTVLHHDGQFIEVTTDAAVDRVRLLQPSGVEPFRRIDEVAITVGDREPFVAALDDRSLVTGQPIEFEPTDGPTTIRIELLSIDFRSPWIDPTPVGFAEIDVGLGHSPEVVSVPRDATDAMREHGVEQPLVFVLTRERVAPTNRWRSDPERRIVRDLDVPFDQSAAVSVDIRLDRRASDTVLADLLGIDGPLASSRLAGVPAAGGWAAADGDGSTAWTTPFGKGEGARLTVDLLDADEPLGIMQPAENSSTITAVQLRHGEVATDVILPPPDDDGWSTIELPDGFEAGALTIEIIAVDEQTTIDRRYGDVVPLPIGIAELTNVAAAELPPSFSTGCRDDLLTVDGVAVPLEVSGTIEAAFAGDVLSAEPCDDDSDTIVDLPAGTVRVEGQSSVRGGLLVDRVVLGHDQLPGEATAVVPTVEVTASSRLGRTVEVDDCPDGCWLILGEGHHAAWSASLDGESLGAPELIAGGFNGWWLPGRDEPVTVTMSWTAQRPLNVAFIASALAGIVALVLIARDRRRRHPPPLEAARFTPLGRPESWRRTLIAAAGYVVAAGLLVEWRYAVWGLLGAAAIAFTRRPRVGAYVAVAALGYIALSVVAYVWEHSPAADPLFPGHFADLHRLGLFAAVSLLISIAARAAGRRSHLGPAGEQERDVERPRGDHG